MLVFLGSVYGGYENPKLTFNEHVKMWQGSNKISILSSAVGLPVSRLITNRIHVLNVIFLKNVSCCRTRATISSHGTSASWGR
jgi:hypothetical protein